MPTPTARRALAVLRHGGGRAAGGPAVPALVGATALVALAAGLGPALVHRCLTAGALGPVALRLDLLGPEPGCPDGTVGLGAAGRALLVLLQVALPAAAVQLVLATVGLGLLTAAAAGARTLVRVARTLVGAAVRRLPRPAASAVRRHARPPAPEPRALAVRDRARGLTWSHRGPPVCA